MYNKVTTPSSEIRRQAREALSGRWKVGVLSAFTYVIVQFVLNLFSSYITLRFNGNQLMNILTSVISLIIVSPIMLGYMNVCLKLSRGQESVPDEVFQGFHITGRAVGLQILINIYVVLWMFIFLIPAVIIFVVGFESMVYDGAVGSTILAFILLIAGIIVGVIKTISYTMSYFVVLDDANTPVGQAISQSKKMMSGNKSKFFWLTMSFVGWELLISLLYSILYFALMGGSLHYKFITGMTVGSLESIGGNLFVYSIIINIIVAIPLLFLQPYIMVSEAKLYDMIVRHDDAGYQYGEQNQQYASIANQDFHSDNTTDDSLKQ